jgi:hypothetical protein
MNSKSYLVNIVANLELKPGVLHGNPGLHVLVLVVLGGDLLHQLGVHLVRVVELLLPSLQVNLLHPTQE